MLKFIKQYLGYILALLVFVSMLSYCTFFSPSARDMPTEEELREMAKEYDAINGTDYSQYLEE